MGGAGEFGGRLKGELVECGGRGVGLGRGHYRLSIAMGEGFGETLTREMGERLEDHLSSGSPLQSEEAMLERSTKRR